jgi:polyisoprenoid-binding protein YceI
MKRFIGSTFTLAALAFAPNMAAAQTWDIDPTHTSVGFEVRHFFTKVAGKFNEVSGTVTFDPANPTAASTDITIPTASVDTRNERRDGHLKSADFFDTENFPNITFKSTKVEKAGENKFKVTGNLTMRGVTKPTVLDMEFLGSGPHMSGGKVAGFSATTRINRQDFGVSWNKTLDTGGTLLSDDVDIRIDVEAVQKPAEAK